MSLPPHHHALGDLPRRAAARTPHKIAVIDGEDTWTFEQLDADVNAIANTLATMGLTHGDRCAILAHNCWQFVALSFATARLGVVLVPINFMLNADEIAYIVDHSQPRAFVAEAALTDVVDQALAQAEHRPEHHIVLGSPTAQWSGFAELLAGPTTPVLVPVADLDPVRLMYTSGTESRPKGVMLTSRSLLWQYATCVIDGSMESDDVDLHALPLYHCAQMDCFFGPDVFVGATSVIAHSPEPGNLLRLMQEHRVTKFFAPPTVWISLLRHPDFDSTDLSSLRKGYYGASAMPVEVLHEIAERLPGVSLWNFYGQTEMSPLATILKPDEQLLYPGSAGRPSINVETMIVDDDDQPVPPGTVGEIVHRSPHAMLGYYRDEAKTADAFRGGWFHSGDLGVFDDNGVLRVVDRKKDMVKTGGENVASREVEEVIYQLDGVSEVAVFGVPDAKWIEAVAAVVVPRADAHLTPDAIKDHTRAHLAGYKTPKHVVIAPSLPKNPSGKILKRELRDSFVVPAQTQ